jgi:hypothetical protein
MDREKGRTNAANSSSRMHSPSEVMKNTATAVHCEISRNSAGSTGSSDVSWWSSSRDVGVLGALPVRVACTAGDRVSFPGTASATSGENDTFLLSLLSRSLLLSVLLVLVLVVAALVVALVVPELASDAFFLAEDDERLNILP